MENTAVNIDTGTDCTLQTQGTGRVPLYPWKSQFIISQASNSPASQEKGSGHYPISMIITLLFQVQSATQWRQHHMRTSGQTTPDLRNQTLHRKKLPR